LRIWALYHRRYNRELEAVGIVKAYPELFCILVRIPFFDFLVKEKK
jgi:hypothetical protein